MSTVSLKHNILYDEMLSENFCYFIWFSLCEKKQVKIWITISKFKQSPFYTVDLTDENKSHICGCKRIFFLKSEEFNRKNLNRQTLNQVEWEMKHSGTLFEKKTKYTKLNVEETFFTIQICIQKSDCLLLLLDSWNCTSTRCHG